MQFRFSAVRSYPTGTFSLTSIRIRLWRMRLRSKYYGRVTSGAIVHLNMHRQASVSLTMGDFLFTAGGGFYPRMNVPRHPAPGIHARPARAYIAASLLIQRPLTLQPFLIERRRIQTRVNASSRTLKYWRPSGARPRASPEGCCGQTQAPIRLPDRIHTCKTPSPDRFRREYRTLWGAFLRARES